MNNPQWRVITSSLAGLYIKLRFSFSSTALLIAKNPIKKLRTITAKKIIPKISNKLIDSSKIKNFFSGLIILNNQEFIE
jgi:hypothetical protein